MQGSSPWYQCLACYKVTGTHTQKEKMKRQVSRIQIKMHEIKKEITAKGNFKPPMSRTATEAVNIYKVSITQSLLVTCHGISAWNKICVFNTNSKACGEGTQYNTDHFLHSSSGYFSLSIFTVNLYYEIKKSDEQ